MKEKKTADADAADVVQALAEAVSTQARVANRAWLVLIALAVVVLVPRPAAGDSNAGVELPFGFGMVEASWFYPVAFLVLAVLLIGFCAAHAQQVRAAKLAHRALAALGSDPVAPGNIHARDYFDMVRMPSISRVAPLAQLVLARYQFHPEAQNCPPWRRVLSAVYYLLLKVVASFVYLILPATALVYSYGRLDVGGPRLWLFAGVGAVAALALIHVLILELKFVIDIALVIGRVRD